MPTVVKISESKIEARLVAFCRKNGLYCRKFASPANRGVPDRIIGKDGVVVFMELKSQGNTPTPLQHRELKELRDKGLISVWCDNYTTATQFLIEKFKLTVADDLTAGHVRALKPRKVTKKDVLALI